MRKDTSTRGWIIVASCFCIRIITDGVRYSYGLLFIEFLREFKQSKTATSWIGALFFGWYIVGPVASILTNKFGCRPVVIFGTSVLFFGFLGSVFGTSIYYLYVSYGCFAGFGIGLIGIPREVMIIQHFEKKRSFAMGISACGSGLGTIVFNPLTNYLIDEYGWRGTLLIEAGLVLNMVPCGLVMRPFVSGSGQDCRGKKVTAQQIILDPLLPSDVTQEKGSKQDTTGVQLYNHENDETTDSVDILGAVDNIASNPFELCDAHNDRAKDTTKERKHILNVVLLKQPKLIILLVSVLFGGTSFFTPFTFIPDMAVNNGWSRAQAAWLLSAIGIVNTLCRVSIGKIADMKWVNRIFAVGVSLCLLAVVTTVMPLLDLYDLLLSVCVIFGIGIAAYVVLHPVMSAELVGEENVADVYGFISLIFGLGSLISGPLSGILSASGALFDATGDYKLTFVNAGAGFAIAAVLTFVLFRITRR